MNHPVHVSSRGITADRFLLNKIKNKMAILNPDAILRDQFLPDARVGIKSMINQVILMRMP